MLNSMVAAGKKMGNPCPFLETFKKRKREAAPRYEFSTFGRRSTSSAASSKVTFLSCDVCFQTFVEQYTEAEDYTVNGMPVWSTLLFKDKFVVRLYCIGEDVRNSPTPFCDHCRFNGWDKHYMTKRRYHIIIPGDDDEWRKRLVDGLLESHTHLLHGVIHCNGIGHLLFINGIEGGSKHLRGRELMDLWDRICSLLGARTISVRDTSNKSSMDLGLLCGVAYGHSWFERWGYKFWFGSFGVNEHQYNAALEILRSLELDKIIHDSLGPDYCTEMDQIIHHYRCLSEGRLISFKDLLMFMLVVRSQRNSSSSSASNTLTKNKKKKKSHDQQTLKEEEEEEEECVKHFKTVVSGLNSRWSKRRLEEVAEIIVDVLKAEKLGRGGMSMTRQDVRNEAKMRIGDTGLIDHVLKSMDNVVVGGYIVRRTRRNSSNPAVKMLEYSIEEHDDCLPAKALVPGADVYRDLYCLYHNVLFKYQNVAERVKWATIVLQRSKYFLKEWAVEDQEDKYLTYLCQVMIPNDEENGEVNGYGPYPTVIVMIPIQATVMELKRAAESALRNTYCILENFEVSEMKHSQQVLEDGSRLFGAVESGSLLSVRGNGMDLNSQFTYEGRPQSLQVKTKCVCGVIENDGERMMACCWCDVQEHTLCNGIHDSDTIPSDFVCKDCTKIAGF